MNGRWAVEVELSLPILGNLGYCYKLTQALWLPDPSIIVRWPGFGVAR